VAGLLGIQPAQDLILVFDAADAGAAQSMADSAATMIRTPSHSAAALKRFGRSDVVFRWFTFATACFVVLVFAGIIAALAEGAWPALRTFGFGFLSSTAWNPVTGKFGALPAIYGTLVSSALAMLIAVPVGIGIAIFLTELCPRPLRRPFGIAIELLAGIPSIIYGIWGLFVFAPFFQQFVEPRIISAFGHIPLLSDVFAGPPYGIGVFTASLILSIMILPFIAAVTRDVFETVPPMLKEAAYGLGCTRREVTWNVVLPFARSGVVGGSMLALGRALGETMAVTFVIGNAHAISSSVFAPGTTISATIANEFTEAVGDLYLSSLVAIGLVLFVITFLVLAVAQLMLRSLEARAGGLAQ
jgi:phosphate transport system permease protein